MTDERLQLICEEFGLVLKATVVCHPVTGKSKGFGFVTFTNRACQQACIAKLDKRELGGGRVLNVRAVETRVPDAPTDGGGGSLLDKGSAKDEAGVGSAKKKAAAGAASESAEDAAKPVCLKYQTNKCHRGRACRWRHVKVSDAKAHNEKIAAAAAAAEVAGGTKAVGSNGSKETATVSKRGAKKGWGGEAIEPKTAGDLGSESEAEDEAPASSSSSGRRDSQAPTVATVKSGKDTNDKLAKKKASTVTIPPASAVPAKPGKATTTTEFGGWSDESEDEEGPASTKNATNVVSFSDDDEDGEGVSENSANGNSMAAMLASANSGTVTFDDDDEDDDDHDVKDANFQSTAAFDSDSDDSDEAPISRESTASASASRSNSKPKGKAKGAKGAATKGDQVAAESNRETLQAEASNALSIMNSLFTN
jgi:hypothetical protein